MALVPPSRVGWTDLRRAPDDSRPPAALVVGMAFAAQLGWVGLAQSLGLPLVADGVGVVAIAVVSCWWLTVPASLLMAMVSFLVTDGFVQGQMGNLQWDGSHDALLALGMLAGCALSSELGSELLEDARRRRTRRSTSTDPRQDS